MFFNRYLFPNHFQRIIFYLWGIILPAQNQVGPLYKFSLRQNYQNPFNPTTTIKYRIAEISFVTINVYD